MTDPQLQANIRLALSRVAYFRTILGPGPGICDVCRGPAPQLGLCSVCERTRTVLNGATCNHTFFLAYADGHHPEGRSQSAETMRSYKAQPPTERNKLDVQLLTNMSTAIHDPCMRQAENGLPWDAATYVPSRTPRSGPHPVAGIARNIARLVGDDPARGGPYQISRVLIEAGPMYAPRIANADRFAVPDGVRPVIGGKRVLLVDDTWTSGTSMQSAAAALLRAGAASVTGLCVARWLSWNWSEHLALLRQVTAAPFDPFSCIAYARVCS